MIGTNITTAAPQTIPAPTAKTYKKVATLNDRTVDLPLELQVANGDYIFISEFSQNTYCKVESVVHYPAELTSVYHVSIAY